MRTEFVLAIDQGTTGSRAILYDRSGKTVASAYQEFRQYYPKPGWVEHDPVEIWRSVLKVIEAALLRGKVQSRQIAVIGITNQRETIILWDKRTGKPVHPAIVWQDRRTASDCFQLKQKGLEKTVREKTGLVLDPYFSGTKIQWLLNHVPGLSRRAQNGEILSGTIDSWILWKLTGGKSHATDCSNASRTLLFNIKNRKWDPELLKVFKIPSAILPQVHDSGSNFGETVKQGALVSGIPIGSLIGDQQAALYGQSCYEAGDVKNTYGTGCFIVMNQGKKWRKPPFGLLSTLACDENGKTVYALEGSIFIAGAAIQWLRDGLGFFHKAAETDAMVKKVKDSGGAVVIPALAGLGSPHWNPDVRGMITGLTRGTTREHIIRATLEAIAHQTVDVIERMAEQSQHAVHELKVDGGATANRFLMQFQADLLGIPILVSDIAESTAWGAAKLAGRSSGFWSSLRAIDKRRKYRRFHSRMRSAERTQLRNIWKREMTRLLSGPANSCR